MSKRKAHYKEVICGCGAYDHPHRLGGGACTGEEWCISFRTIDTFECMSCIHGQGDGCDVVTGQEELNDETCACLAGEIRTGSLHDEYGYLPLDFDEYMEQQYKSHYEDNENKP